MKCLVCGEELWDCLECNHGWYCQNPDCSEVGVHVDKAGDEVECHRECVRR